MFLFLTTGCAHSVSLWGFGHVFLCPCSLISSLGPDVAQPQSRMMKFQPVTYITSHPATSQGNNIMHPPSGR